MVVMGSMIVLLGCRRRLGLHLTIGCPERPNHVASISFVSAGPFFGTRIPNFLETAVFSGFVKLLATRDEENKRSNMGR
jgi:hypothetical protein